MSNTLLTPSVITKEALMVLHEEMQFSKKIDRQLDEEFGQKNKKIGSSITIRKPPKFTVSDGAAYSAQDAQEGSTTLTVNKQKHVDMEFTSSELTLSLEEFSDRFVRPAMQSLASYMDADCLTMYQDVYNLVGTPGTDPASVAAVLSAGTRLSDYGIPGAGRNLIVNPAGQASLVDGVKALQNNAKLLAEQYRTGEMGEALGFDFAMSQSIKRHTVGTKAGTPLVNGASQTGASLVTDGWSNSSAILKKGDVFTVAGVYAVTNPTGAVAVTQPFLQQFVVTEDVSSSGTGTATIAISPEIITSGKNQTVAASPANDAAITVAGTASTAFAQNMAFVKSAFTLATVKLEQPRGVDFAASEVWKENGLALRIVRQYDITDDKFKTRIDIMYGYKTQMAEAACRLAGQ
jgi:hypothetical protein